MNPYEEQVMDFAYGNLACSTNHKPSKEAFEKLAKLRGWTDAEWEEWSNKRVWEVK